MEGAKFEGSNAQYNEYKKTCPPAWIVSTRFRQDETGDVRIGGVGGSASPPDPVSSDTLVAQSQISPSRVREAADGGRRLSTPISENDTDSRASASRTKNPTPSSKSSPRSKLKSVFDFRSRSKSKSSSGQTTINASPKLATENMDVDIKDDTPKQSESTFKQFRWPIATSPAVDAGMASTRNSQPPTAGLKFQPKQSTSQPPKSHSAAPATASSQPPPPEATSTASAAQGPPPAPSASANNPKSRYDTVRQNSSAVSGSMSAVSGYSASTNSDLADVPSRLPYQSPSYSPGYSYH